MEDSPDRIDEKDVSIKVTWVWSDAAKEDLRQAGVPIEAYQKQIEERAEKYSRIGGQPAAKAFGWLMGEAKDGLQFTVSSVKVKADVWMITGVNFACEDVE